MFTNLLGINRRTFTRITYSLLIPALLVLACKNQQDPIALPTPQTVAQLLTTNSRFTLLTAALNRAGLTTTLSRTGPYTIFAPSDDAFRAAGLATVAAINATPDTTLRQLLQYHVINGSVPASAITVGQLAQPTSLSVNGIVYTSRVASTTGTGVSVDGSRILQTDVLASNGRIHIIDKLLAQPMGSILTIARADTSLSLFVALAERAGPTVTGSLSGTGITPVTAFAPTNAAFRAAGVSDTTAIRLASVAAVTSIITNHLLPGVRAYSPTLVRGAIVSTVGGSSLTVTSSTTSSLTIKSRGNGTEIPRAITTDINATNGVIHKIDRVLLP